MEHPRLLVTCCDPGRLLLLASGVDVCCQI